MKKMKWMIMTLVVCLSIGGALATTPQGDCRTQAQYYMIGGGYMPAGSFGVNYTCDAAISTCTYTTDGFGNYFPCRSGVYHFIQLNGTSPNATQK
jgi:hypothetical protein